MDRSSYQDPNMVMQLFVYVQSTITVPFKLGSLSTRVFETLTATGSEYFARQDIGLNQIFILIIYNGEKILSDINVVV